MSRLTVISWADTVIAHEMAHIFQLGQISSRLKYLKLLFKNSEVIFIPFPVFLNVNLVMSLFFLEGHAVLSESIFAPGGRLYSGSVRALVFSQLKNRFRNTNHFIRNYLINLTEDTFSAKQQYTHGGYFFNSLLDNYSLKTVNRFFENHAEHFLLPLTFVAVKSSFEKVFQNSFESLVHYYIQKYLPLAKKQKKSKEKALFKSDVCPAFNKRNNEIFFLTSNLKSAPVLRSYNLSSGKWKKRKKVFSIGKVFKIKDEYYVSATGRIGVLERVYGLFSEGMHLVKKYKSQYVQDMYKNQTLSMDSSNNMRDFKLLLDGQFYDQVHSPALFGPAGDIYYFKQEGEQRVMYKNRQFLFQFKGFYGKPVEIAQNGSVYFIAASPYGSSLFVWHPMRGIYRLSSSDVIVDAVQLTEDQFLVCEVEPHFYNYKRITVMEQMEVPAFYSYRFENFYQSLSTLSSLSKVSKTNILEEEDTEDIEDIYIQQLEEIDQKDQVEAGDSNKLPADIVLGSPAGGEHHHHHHGGSLGNDLTYSSYNSLRHISFTGLSLGVVYDGITGYNGITTMSFKDPMEYNSFQMFYRFSLENWNLQAKYINQRRWVSWNLQYNYKQGWENVSGSRTYSYIHEIGPGFRIPLLRSHYWNFSFYLNNAFSSVEFKDLPGRSYYFITEPGLRFWYGRSYEKNFDYHREFLAQISGWYNINFSKKDPNFKLKGDLFHTMHWGWEFYTVAFASYQSALKPKSIPFRYFKPLGMVDHLERSYFISKKIFGETDRLFFGGLKIQKFIETPAYFTYFPLSLRALAPSFGGKYVQFTDNKQAKELQFVEWTAGLKVGLLIHHKIKASLNIYGGYTQPLDFVFLKVPEKKAPEQRAPEKNLHFGMRFQSGF